MSRREILSRCRGGRYYRDVEEGDFIGVSRREILSRCRGGRYYRGVCVCSLGGRCLCLEKEVCAQRLDQMWCLSTAAGTYNRPREVREVARHGTATAPGRTRVPRPTRTSPSRCRCCIAHGASTLDARESCVAARTRSEHVERIESTEHQDTAIPGRFAVLAAHLALVTLHAPHAKCVQVLFATLVFHRVRHCPVVRPSLCAVARG